MAQWLKVCIALSEDSVSIPSIHSGLPVTPTPRDLILSSSILGHMHREHIYTAYIHIINHLSFYLSLSLSVCLSVSLILYMAPSREEKAVRVASLPMILHHQLVLSLPSPPLILNSLPEKNGDKNPTSRGMCHT